jgi:hypothetical protein
MPVYPETEEETDETNPYLLDLLDISNTENQTVGRSQAIFKLKPINVVFSIFERMFFKKRRGVYSTTKTTFLESLLNKLKPKLTRELRKYTPTARNAIALSHEIFELTIADDTRLRSQSLTHREFVRAIDTTNDTYVRVTVHLALNSIATDLTIEFIFKVMGIPCNQDAFDADDLFL